MTPAAPPEASGRSTAMDSFVVSSLRGTFGFGQSEAEHLARAKALTRVDLKLWEAFLEERTRDKGIQNPKAYVASLMRIYNVPPTPNGRRDTKPQPTNPHAAKLAALAAKGAWWLDPHGRRWAFEVFGLRCLDVNLGILSYSAIPDKLERVISEARAE